MIYKYVCFFKQFLTYFVSTALVVPWVVHCQEAIWETHLPQKTPVFLFLEGLGFFMLSVHWCGLVILVYEFLDGSVAVP